MENSLQISQEASKPSLPAWLKISAAVCFALVVIGLPCLDLMRSKSAQSADFIVSHYVAATLADTGRADLLYTPATSESAHNEPFTQAAHKILPWMRSNLRFDEYLYMPLVPRLFIPVSCLAPHIALLCWQAISLAAFLFSTWLVTERKKNKDDIWILLVPFTFFPVLHTFWQGNVSLAFGYLMFAMSFYLLQRHKPFWAGVVLSLTALKTQFLLTASLIALTELFGKRKNMILGLASGLMLIALITVGLCGIHQCLDWLHCMKGSDALYIESRIAERYAIGLPRTIATMLQLPSILRTEVYFLCALLAVPPLVLAYRLEKTELPDSFKVALKYVLLCMLPPLIVPHFFIYDLNLYVLAGIFLLTAAVPEKLADTMKPHVYFLWLATNVYSIVAVWLPAYAQPLILDAIILVFSWRLWQAVEKLTAKTSEQEDH
jgi:hypothetical protein